ncbi:MAG TPA: 50S ribosomal protein L15 [Saprospiraceae bacterium]|nr:50S ribosomal protein L15 [Saprospiraceae bacterium]
MKLHELKPSKGATKNKKRVGRGEGSKRGGTSTRGHNGAKSRSGYSKKRNFEGGQMPLQKRVPKRGFFSRNRKVYVPFNLDRLTEIAEKHSAEEINLDFLVEKSYVRKKEMVKILGDGELKKPLKLTAHAASESAKKAVEEAGGSITIV